MGQNSSRRRSYTPGRTKNSEVAWPTLGNGNGSSTPVEVGHRLDNDDDEREEVDISTLSTPADTATSSSTPAGKTDKRKRFRVGFPLRRTPSGRWSRKRKSLLQNGVRPVSGEASLHTEQPETTSGPGVLTQQPEVTTNGHAVDVNYVTDKGDRHSQPRLLRQDKSSVRASAKLNGRRGSQKSSSRKKKKEKPKDKKKKKQNSSGDGKTMGVMVLEMTERETDALKDAPGDEVLAHSGQSVNDVQVDWATLTDMAVSEVQETADKQATVCSPARLPGDHTHNSLTHISLTHNSLTHIRTSSPGTLSLPHAAGAGSMLSDSGSVPGRQTVNNDVEYFMNNSRRKVVDRTTETSFQPQLQVSVSGEHVPDKCAGVSLPLVGNAAVCYEEPTSLPLANAAFGYEEPISLPIMQAVDGGSTAEIPIKELTTSGAGWFVDLPSNEISTTSTFVDVCADETSRPTPSLYLCTEEASRAGCPPHLAPSVRSAVAATSVDLSSNVELSSVTADVSSTMEPLLATTSVDLSSSTETPSVDLSSTTETPSVDISSTTETSSVDLSSTTETPSVDRFSAMDPSRPPVYEHSDANTQICTDSVPLELADLGQHSTDLVVIDPETFVESSASLDEPVPGRPSHVSLPSDLSPTADLGQHSTDLVVIDPATFVESSASLDEPVPGRPSHVSLPSDLSPTADLGQHSTDLVVIDPATFVESSASLDEPVPGRPSHVSLPSDLSPTADLGQHSTDLVVIDPATFVESSASLDEPVPGRPSHVSLPSDLSPTADLGQHSTDLVVIDPATFVESSASLDEPVPGRPSHVSLPSDLSPTADLGQHSTDLVVIDPATFVESSASLDEPVPGRPSHVSLPSDLSPTADLGQHSTDLVVIDPATFVESSASLDEPVPGRPSHVSLPSDLSPTADLDTVINVDSVEVSPPEDPTCITCEQQETTLPLDLTTVSAGLSWDPGHPRNQLSYLPLTLDQGTVSTQHSNMPSPLELVASNLGCSQVSLPHLADIDVQPSTVPLPHLADIDGQPSTGPLPHLADIDGQPSTGPLPHHLNSINCELPNVSLPLVLDYSNDEHSSFSFRFDQYIINGQHCKVSQSIQGVFVNGDDSNESPSIDGVSVNGERSHESPPYRGSANNKPTDLLPSLHCDYINDGVLASPAESCVQATLPLSTQSDADRSRVQATSPLSTQSDADRSRVQATLPLSTQSDADSDAKCLQTSTTFVSEVKLRVESSGSLFTSSQVESAGDLLTSSQVESASDLFTSSQVESAGDLYTSSQAVPEPVLQKQTVPSSQCFPEDADLLSQEPVLDTEADISGWNVSPTCESPASSQAGMYVLEQGTSEVVFGKFPVTANVQDPETCGELSSVDNYDEVGEQTVELDVATDVAEEAGVTVTPEVKGSENGFINIPENNEEKFDEQWQEIEHVNNQQKDLSALDTETLTRTDRKHQEHGAGGKKEKGQTNGDKLAKFQRKLTDWFHKTDKKAQVGENEQVQTQDAQVSTTDAKTLENSLLLETEEAKEAAVDPEMWAATETKPSISPACNRTNLDLKMEPASLYILSQLDNTPTHVSLRQVSNEAASTLTPGSSRHDLNEAARASTPVSPTSPSWYTYKLTSPSSDGDGSSFLKRISLGSRLRTAILRKKSAGSPEGCQEERRISLTRPRSMQVGDLTPSSMKWSTRELVDQTPPSIDREYNGIFLCGASNEIQTTTCHMDTSSRPATVTSKIDFNNSCGLSDNYVPENTLPTPVHVPENTLLTPIHVPELTLLTPIHVPENTLLTPIHVPENTLLTPVHVPENTLPTHVYVPENTLPIPVHVPENTLLTHIHVPENTLLTHIHVPENTLLTPIHVPENTLPTPVHVAENTLLTPVHVPENTLPTPVHVPENTLPTPVDDSRVEVSSVVCTPDFCAPGCETVTDNSSVDTEMSVARVTGLVSGDGQDDTCQLLDASTDDENTDGSEGTASLPPDIGINWDLLDLSNPQAELNCDTPVSPESTLEVNCEQTVPSVVGARLNNDAPVLSEQDEGYVGKPVPLKEDVGLNCEAVELYCKQLVSHILEAGLKCEKTGLCETVGEINCDSSALSLSLAATTRGESVICEFENDTTCVKSISPEPEFDNHCDKTVISQPEFDNHCDRTIISEPEFDNHCDKTVISQPEFDNDCDKTVISQPEFDNHYDKTVISQPEFDNHCDKTVISEPRTGSRCDNPILYEPKMEVNCVKTILTQPEFDTKCDKAVQWEPEFATNCDQLILPGSEVEIKCEEIVLTEPETGIKCTKAILTEPETGISCNRTILSEAEPGLLSKTELSERKTVNHSDLPAVSEIEFRITYDESILSESKAEVNCSRPAHSNTQDGSNCDKLVLSEQEAGINCDKLVLSEQEAGINCDKLVLNEQEAGTDCDKLVLSERQDGINCAETESHEQEIVTMRVPYSYSTRLVSIELTKVSSNITEIPSQTSIPCTENYTATCTFATATGETIETHTGTCTVGSATGETAENHTATCTFASATGETAESYTATCTVGSTTAETIENHTATCTFASATGEAIENHTATCTFASATGETIENHTATCTFASAPGETTESHHQVAHSISAEEVCTSTAPAGDLSPLLSTTSTLTSPRTTQSDNPGSVLVDSVQVSTHEQAHPAAGQQSGRDVVCADKELVSSEGSLVTSENKSSRPVSIENGLCSTDNVEICDPTCGHPGVRTIAEYYIGVSADLLSNGKEEWPLADLDIDTHQEALTSCLTSDSALSSHGNVQS